MPATNRYRLDFVVPDQHDVAEPDSVTRNPTLDLIRTILAADDRWERSMLAPFRPYGEGQHLIVWVDTERPGKAVIGVAVSEIVREVLPGVTLTEIVQTAH